MLASASARAGLITVEMSQVFGSHSASHESPFEGLDSWYRDLPNLQGPVTHNNFVGSKYGSASQSCYASGYGVLSNNMWFLSGTVQSSFIAADNGIGDQNNWIGGLAHGIYYNQFVLAQAGTLILLSHGNASNSGDAVGQVVVQIDDQYMYLGPSDYELVKTLGAGRHTISIDADSSATGRKAGPATSMAYASSAYQFSIHCPQVSYNKTLNGTVTLAGLSGSPAGRIVTLDVIQNGVTVQTTTDRLDANGKYSVNSFVSGAADVFVRTDGWLRKKAGNVLFNTTVVTAPAVVLGNSGDIDGDNGVTVFDYSILSDYFDRSSADPDWDVIGPNGARPSSADLDGDGAVTVFDYALLSDNFDLFGS